MAKSANTTSRWHVRGLKHTARPPAPSTRPAPTRGSPSCSSSSCRTPPTKGLWSCYESFERSLADFYADFS
jgi:hypothetical protein